MELRGSFKEPLIERQSSITNPFSKPALPGLSISDLVKDFTSYKSDYICTPFQGTCLRITNDQKYFVFGSREGRLAMCDIESKQLIHDTDLKEGSIWSIAMTDDSVYSAGQGGAIRRFQLGKFTEIQRLVGHTSEVNMILLSKDSRYLFSCSDDGNVKKWELGEQPKGTKLYGHMGMVYGMDLGEDNFNIASCASDGSVKVFSLIDGSNKFDETLNAKMWCVKISPANKQLIAGGSDGIIHVWSFGDWKLLNKFRGHKDRVRCLNVSSDARVLVSGGIDSMIKVWDLYNFKEEITIYGHKNWVKAILISKDNKNIYSMSDDCTIMTSKIPSFDIDINVKTPARFNNFIFNSKDSFFYSVSDHMIHKSSQSKFEEFQIIDKGILSAHLIKDSTEFVIFMLQEKSTEIEIKTFSLTERSEKIRTFKTTSIVSSAIASEDGRLLITGEAFRITVWNNHSASHIAVLKSHTGDVTALELKGNHLFAGDSKGIVKYYHPAEQPQEISQFVSGTASEIKEIRVSRDLKTLVYSTAENLVLIWAIAAKVLVKVVELGGSIKRMCISNDSRNLFFAHQDKVDVWNLDCYTRCTQLTFREEVQSLGLRSNESHLLIGFQNWVKIMQNPLRVNQFAVFGNHDHSGKFIEYVNQIIRGEIPKHDPSMDTWLIQPYHMNILHIYAFFNLHRYIEKSLERNAPFFPSRNGTTPISLSIEKKLQECTEAFLDHFKRHGEANPFIYYYLSDSLPELNKSSHPKLHLLYDQIFKKSFDQQLPKFCESTVKLPIVKASKRILIPRNKYLKDSSYVKQDTSVEFLQSYVKIPVVVGSRASLDFLSSLIECKNVEIFNSRLVRLVLEEKWKKVRLVYFIETFLYLAYLVLFSMYSVSNSLRSKYMLIAPMSINGLLFMNEVLQMAYSRSKYFKSFWNYIDLIRFLLFTYYFIIIFQESQSKYTQDVTMITALIFSLIRGISYFRLHPSTRWVISLIFDVFFNLWAMFSVALYAIMAMFIFYYCVDAEYKMNDIQVKLKDVEYEWFMIFSVVIINPMIILNLFISIIGDAFEKSQDEKVVKNGRDLADIVFEAELLFLWKRNDQQKRFFGVITEEHLESLAQCTPGQRMKKIAETVEELNGVAGKNREEVEEIKKWVEVKVREIMAKTDGVLAKVSG